MVKRIFNLLLITSLIFLLASCKEQQGVEDIFDTAFEELSLLIPSQIEEDFELPQLSNSDLTVLYTLNGEVVVNRVIQYEETLNDLTLEIKVSISSSEETREYQITIIQQGVKIGRSCIINTGATIDHESIIHDYLSLGTWSHA